MNLSRWAHTHFVCFVMLRLTYVRKWTASIFSRRQYTTCVSCGAFWFPIRANNVVNTSSRNLRKRFKHLVACLIVAWCWVTGCSALAAVFSIRATYGLETIWATSWRNLVMSNVRNKQDANRVHSLISVFGIMFSSQFIIWKQFSYFVASQIQDSDFNFCH